MFESPTKATGVNLLGSAANTQYGMHVGLVQLAEPPTQTTERVEKALRDLVAINMTPSALRRRGC